MKTRITTTYLVPSNYSSILRVAWPRRRRCAARYYRTLGGRGKIYIYIYIYIYNFFFFFLLSPLSFSLSPAGRARSITQLPHYLRIAALRRTIIAVRSSFALNTSRRLRIPTTSDNDGYDTVARSARCVFLFLSLSFFLNLSLSYDEDEGRTGRRGISLYTSPRWRTSHDRITSLIADKIEITLAKNTLLTHPEKKTRSAGCATLGGHLFLASYSTQDSPACARAHARPPARIQTKKTTTRKRDYRIARSNTLLEGSR